MASASRFDCVSRRATGREVVFQARKGRQSGYCDIRIVCPLVYTTLLSTEIKLKLQR